MDDVRVSRTVVAVPALATVVRQFAGSRVERQLLAKVFDWAWRAGGRATSPQPMWGQASRDSLAAESEQRTATKAIFTEGVVS
jgi:hypothetical protein